MREIETGSAASRSPATPERWIFHGPVDIHMFLAAAQSIEKYPANPLTAIRRNGVSYSIQYARTGKSYTIRRNE
jgi:hypothetical protein